MIAVVTGAYGFLGSYLVHELQQHGYDVHLWDLPRHDIRKPPPLPYGTRYVFHLAALTDIVPSVADPIPYMGTNVQGTVRMLERARECPTLEKFVYAASASCYGDEPPVPTPESAPKRCRYPYALSKYLGELAAFNWRDVYGVPVNSLRIFNAYGRRRNPRTAYGAVLSVFLKQKLEGKPLTIIGDGTQARDFVHASDVARAFRLAAESPITGQAWNVGSGRPFQIGHIATMIGGGARDGYVYLEERPGEPKVTQADISLIQRDLGWKSETPLEDGLRDMLAHIDDVRDFPLWTADSIADATADWHRVLGERAHDSTEGEDG